MADTPTTTNLADYTTLRLGGPARRFVAADTDDELIQRVTAADRDDEPLLLLGGGSNLVVADKGFDGTVLRIATEGSHTVHADDAVLVDAAAGMVWDDFVADCVERGFGGLECLSGIPGLVGATPIQNVGAYGWEIAEFVRSVDFFDRRGGQRRTLSPAELRFGYRTSALKGTDAGVVLGVRFALHPDGLSQPIRYAELANQLGVAPGTRVPSAKVRDAVLALRRGKGMVLDPADHDTWSAGSFFTNPIIPATEADAALARIADVVGPDVRVPNFADPGGTKLSAAWLIDRAGFGKGYPGPGNRVTLSSKHTLALTNRGTASTADLLALAGEVRAGVAARFGVTLQPEPLLINCAL